MGNVNDKTRSDMENKRLEVLQKVADGTITPEQAHKELWDLSSVSNSLLEFITYVYADDERLLMSEKEIVDRYLNQL